jgi:nucleotide-binding universal stress UspA family protein
MNAKPHIILVGVDFSELADRALEQALLIAAERRNVELHALSIVPVPMALDGRYAIPAYGVLDQANSLEAASERVRVHVQARLELFAEQHPGCSFPKRVISHANFGAPSLGIAQLASDLGADLVVVGTHNRRGVERLLLGSVAEGTVRHAHCPVLVIPAPQPHDEVAIAPPCSQCAEARRESGGEQLWCAQHRERHGRRHTYHQADRSGAESNFPLVTR